MKKSTIKQSLNNIARNSNIIQNLTNLAEELKAKNSDQWQWETILDQSILGCRQDIIRARYRAILMLLQPEGNININEHIQYLSNKRNFKNRDQVIKIQEKFLEIIKSNQLEEAESCLDKNINFVLSELFYNVLCLDASINKSRRKNYDINISSFINAI